MTQQLNAYYRKRMVELSKEAAHWNRLATPKHEAYLAAMQSTDRKIAQYNEFLVRHFGQGIIPDLRTRKDAAKNNVENVLKAHYSRGLSANGFGDEVVEEYNALRDSIQQNIQAERQRFTDWEGGQEMANQKRAAEEGGAFFSRFGNLYSLDVDVTELPRTRDPWYARAIQCFRNLFNPEIKRFASDETVGAEEYPEVFAGEEARFHERQQQDQARAQQRAAEEQDQARVQQRFQAVTEEDAIGSSRDLSESFVGGLSATLEETRAAMEKLTSLVAPDRTSTKVLSTPEPAISAIADENVANAFAHQAAPAQPEASTAGVFAPVVQGQENQQPLDDGADYRELFDEDAAAAASQQAAMRALARFSRAEVEIPHIAREGVAAAMSKRYTELEAKIQVGNSFLVTDEWQRTQAANRARPTAPSAAPPVYDGPTPAPVRV